MDFLGALAKAKEVDHTPIHALSIILRLIFLRLPLDWKKKRQRNARSKKAKLLKVPIFHPIATHQRANFLWNWKYRKTNESQRRWLQWWFYNIGWWSKYGKVSHWNISLSLKSIVASRAGLSIFFFTIVNMHLFGPWILACLCYLYGWMFLIVVFLFIFNLLWQLYGERTPSMRGISHP